jgi:hypothetical protein
MTTSYTPKPNSGIAFTNKFKTTDKQPSFVVQSVTIGGRAYKGAFWERTDKNGKPFNTFIFEDAVEVELSRHEQAMEKLRADGDKEPERGIHGENELAK